jgi:hypothetical protein
LEKIASVQWLLERRCDALKTLRIAAEGVLSGTISLADEAGGVSQGLLLWYCGATAGDIESVSYASEYLRVLSSKPRIKYWPGVLASYMLREMSQDDTLLQITGTTNREEAIRDSETDVLRRRELVKTLFYFALKSRIDGKEEDCRCGMLKCARLENPILEVEWYLAQKEVEDRE